MCRFFFFCNKTYSYADEQMKLNQLLGHSDKFVSKYDAVLDAEKNRKAIVKQIERMLKHNTIDEDIKLINSLVYCYPNFIGLALDSLVENKDIIVKRSFGFHPFLEQFFSQASSFFAPHSLGIEYEDVREKIIVFLEQIKKRAPEYFATSSQEPDIWALKSHYRIHGTPDIGKKLFSILNRHDDLIESECYYGPLKVNSINQIPPTKLPINAI